MYFWLILVVVEIEFVAIHLALAISPRKAVRKLQHPVRSRQLKGFLEGVLEASTN